MRPKQKRVLYALLFLLLLGAEIAIGMFVQDAFVRPYVGDILIIVLLCCLVRIAVPEKPVCLGLYMIFAGAAAELLQLIHLDRLLHAEGTLLGVILGSTFDIMDLFCYAAGGACSFSLQRDCSPQYTDAAGDPDIFYKLFPEERQAKGCFNVSPAASLSKRPVNRSAFYLVNV